MIKAIQKMKSKEGFTLIELIVVIAILAILAVIAVPRLVQNIDSATNSENVATARTLNGAVAMYLAIAGNDVTDFAGDNVAQAVARLETAGLLQPGTSTTGITFNAATATFTGTVTP